MYQRRALYSTPFRIGTRLKLLRARQQAKLGRVAPPTRSLAGSFLAPHAQTLGPAIRQLTRPPILLSPHTALDKELAPYITLPSPPNQALSPHYRLQHAPTGNPIDAVLHWDTAVIGDPSVDPSLGGNSKPHTATLTCARNCTSSPTLDLVTSFFTAWTALHIARHGRPVRPKDDEEEEQEGPCTERSPAKASALGERCTGTRWLGQCERGDARNRR